jgi:hypothetical protein
MKCLTLCEPFASAVMGTGRAAGVKRCENRPKNMGYTGPLLIHAGLSREWLGEFGFCQGLMPQLRYQDMTYGAILGVVDAVGWFALAEYRRRWPGDPWAFGPWCLRVENPRRFERPIRWRGQLGIFEVPDEVLGGQAGEAGAEAAPWF